MDRETVNGVACEYSMWRNKWKVAKIGDKLAERHQASNMDGERGVILLDGNYNHGKVDKDRKM